MTIRNMLKLYFVAGTQDCPKPTADRSANLLLILEQALQAGITCFQFRDKGENSLTDFPEKQRELAIKCRDLCRKYGVPFIINDDVKLAFEIDADGIHVGQSDENIDHIDLPSHRKMIVGLTVNTLEQACQNKANSKIDYFGIGPIFPTLSKKDHTEAVGMDFPQKLRAAGIHMPCVAIGGVKAAHVATLRKNGADGVAVISAICLAPAVSQAVKTLLKADG